jgi:hypothetical protein
MEPWQEYLQDGIRMHGKITMLTSQSRAIVTAFQGPKVRFPRWLPRDGGTCIFGNLRRRHEPAVPLHKSKNSSKYPANKLLMSRNADPILKRYMFWSNRCKELSVGLLLCYTEGVYQWSSRFEVLLYDAQSSAGI